MESIPPGDTEQDLAFGGIWRIRVFELTDNPRVPFRATSILKLSSIENVCVSMPELGSAPRFILGGGSNLVVLEPDFEVLSSGLKFVVLR